MRYSLFFALFAFTQLAQAESTSAIADNGREVVLNEDGSWTYKSNDIFATTETGQRVKLQPNGQWQAVEKAMAPAPISTPRQPVQYVTVQNPALDTFGDIRLDLMTIETQRETVGKNTRKRSNLVLYVDTGDSLITPAAAKLKVMDSKGREYPVFSSERGTSQPGGQPRLVIRAKGAPRFWGVKFFSLQLAPGTLGNDQGVELRKPMSDVLRKEVNVLPEDNL